MIEAVKTCFSKYFTFSGRARRPEYWWFFLFVILVGIVGNVIDGLLFGLPTEEGGSGPVATVAGLATLIPLLAVGWRRMHDTGRSGWLYILPTLVMLGGLLISALVLGTVGFPGGPGPEGATGFMLLPMLGMLAAFAAFLLVVWWLTRPSDPGPNAYGPEPVP
jgi:uncharacterized membrane protein YhaH (DUF805 family)